MSEPSPASPEARRGLSRHLAQLGISARVIEVAKRVAIGVYSDGFTHAGNLAYLSLVTLFPFFIVATAIARLLGRTGDGVHAVAAFLRTVPPGVAQVLEQPILEVLNARTGSLLWFGAIIGLWTTAGFIETVRSILRQAYGTPASRPFWENRLGSIGLIIGSVILAMAAFSFQVALTGVEAFINRVLPFAHGWERLISVTKIAPAIALFVALYILFYSLTPGKYRRARCPKWPGPAFTTAWWLMVTALLPPVLDAVTNYGLTYGSLAGVMVALIFFFLIGLGVVIGAELNAALADEPDPGLEGDQQPPQGNGTGNGHT